MQGIIMYNGFEINKMLENLQGLIDHLIELHRMYSEKGLSECACEVSDLITILKSIELR